MKSYCAGVDLTLTEADLLGLASRLGTPSGWSVRTRRLDEELVADTRFQPATVVQDELANTYSLHG